VKEMGCIHTETGLVGPFQSVKSMSVKTNAQGRRGVEISFVLTSILPRQSLGMWDEAGGSRADGQLWMGRLW